MLLGQIPRELTLDDAEAFLRSRGVRRIAPLTIGSATLSHGALNREVVVLGSTSDLLEVRHMSLGIGRFCPPVTCTTASRYACWAAKIKRELFGNDSRWAMGAAGRPAFPRGRRNGDQGESMGMNTDEFVIVPVASAHMLFNTSGLFRVLIEAKNRDSIEQQNTTCNKLSSTATAANAT